MIKEVEKIYAAYLIGACSEAAVIDWATNTYSVDAKAEYASLLLDIASLSKQTDERYQIGPYLKTLIDSFFPQFYQNQERLTIEVVKQRCEQLLNNKIRPYDLCKLITPIEQEFNFPKWLGDLYNVCDWCEPETKTDEHLIAEVIKRITEFEKILKEK